MRKMLAAALFFFLCIQMIAFAESWFVCLGSFKVEENAKNFVKALENKGFKAGIDKQKLHGAFYYRVLLQTDFSDIKEARQKRDNLSASAEIRALKLKGLWVCGSSDEFSKKLQSDAAGANAAQKPIVLQGNTAEHPLSKTKPYALLIKKYKEEGVAEHDRDRLKAEDLPAYIIKTYDDSDYFSFGLHIGAFSDEESARKEQEQLQARGITSAGISNYQNLSAAMQRYDEVVAKASVQYEDGKMEIPHAFSHHVSECIREFPINKDFQIKSLYIFDFDNIRAAGTHDSNMSVIEDVLHNAEGTHAASIGFYRDTIFNKDVSILIESGDAGSYSVPDGTKKLQLRLKKETIQCSITMTDRETVLTGTNKEGSLLVSMKSADFSEKEFDAFLNNITNDSGLLTYPQMRKALLVLPKQTPEKKRDFCSFALEQVEDSYAKAKGFAVWAIPIVGHWRASGEFSVRGGTVSIAFFDMDYDYNAKKIHGMFIDSHSNDSINLSRPIELKRVKGYMVSTYSGHEISFSFKSFIIAVDANTMNFETAELADISDDLAIWE